MEVQIGREEMRIWSYPGPDRSVKLAALSAGRALPRRYRNWRIGEFLMELDLTEGRGTSISKIIGAMRRNGSPPPVFDFDEDHSYFEVILPIHPAAAGDGATPHETPHETPHHEQWSVGSPDQATPHVTPQVERVLQLVQTGPLTRAELLNALGLADRKSLRAAYLQPAITAGLLEMTLPNAPQSRNQRCRLTEAGAAWRGKLQP